MRRRLMGLETGRSLNLRLKLWPTRLIVAVGIILQAARLETTEQPTLLEVRSELMVLKTLVSARSALSY